jgi:hypothetical protein
MPAAIVPVAQMVAGKLQQDSAEKNQRNADQKALALSQEQENKRKADYDKRMELYQQQMEAYEQRMAPFRAANLGVLGHFGINPKQGYMGGLTSRTSPGINASRLPPSLQAPLPQTMGGTSPGIDASRLPPSLQAGDPTMGPTTPGIDASRLPPSLQAGPMGMPPMGPGGPVGPTGEAFDPTFNPYEAMNLGMAPKRR